MPKIDDGGAAFPSPSVYGDENVGHQQLEVGELGMSLRDWFAGQVLSAFTGERIVDTDALARTCYRLADAMLAARKQ